jgi:hypothetical protein
MTTETNTETKIKWKDVRGIAPDLLKGEDAQKWVDRIRSGNSENHQPQVLITHYQAGIAAEYWRELIQHELSCVNGSKLPIDLPTSVIEQLDLFESILTVEIQKHYYSYVGQPSIIKTHGNLIETPIIGYALKESGLDAMITVIPFGILMSIWRDRLFQYITIIDDRWSGCRCISSQSYNN